MNATQTIICSICHRPEQPKCSSGPRRRDWVADIIRVDPAKICQSCWEEITERLAMPPVGALFGETTDHHAAGQRAKLGGLRS